MQSRVEFLGEGIIAPTHLLYTMHGNQQELETLINEAYLLLAKYLRNEGESWVPIRAIT
ncbi:MAG TPA: hypothetical protein VJ249_01625 [Candidatus Bathyarchaeia archaeon]|nr:hypothetical protein [Candidatus Bathyarchaeia archaeon]